MLNFMNNPTGDAPWEEEEGAEDVRHVYKSAVSLFYFVVATVILKIGFKAKQNILVEHFKT